MNTTEILLSIPPAATHPQAQQAPEATFATSDPPGRQLGSGGGTAHLLVEAWKAASPHQSFREWLRRSRKLMIHGSGQSRRLPAYAAEGKLMLPLPPLASTPSQRINQTLLSLQIADYGHLLRHAPTSYCLVVACGDVLIREAQSIPIFPLADVLIAGIPASPAEASNHGVMFCPSEHPNQLDFFLQKPSPNQIAELALKHNFYLDTGIWFLSEAAVMTLLHQCGWDDAREQFQDGVCQPYELFDRFGTALGQIPIQADAEIAKLQSAVLPLPNGRFYHFGTNRSVFSSLTQLTHPAESKRSFGHANPTTPDDQIIFHAAAQVPASVRPLWIENATVPISWSLQGAHVLTAIPQNTWSLQLPAGACLDMPAIQGLSGRVIRPYGFDDTFKGILQNPQTQWMGQCATAWFQHRNITFEEAHISPESDIQNAALFPVIPLDDPLLPALIQWMFTVPDADALDATVPSSELKSRWLNAPRISATDLVQRASLAPIQEQRLEHIRAQLMPPSLTDTPAWLDPSRQLDLQATAALFNQLGITEISPIDLPQEPPLAAVHDAIFRSALQQGNSAFEQEAFSQLRHRMIQEMTLQPVKPSRNILDDQIIWGRSPARIDLAGGWSDTPPYCIEHGGQVVNIAVDLNGQPPIQAFARLCEAPHIVLHSIDLGISETIDSYEALQNGSDLGGFSIARAALRLAGFDPLFHREGGHASLAQQLKAEFGGGIELSMLAAIPKGSGLGTSSILAGTILGVLGEICNHHWSQQDLFARTTVLEQILTSGGGWQDQVGGLTPGVKITSTQADIAQSPEIRWLPETLIQDCIQSGRLLLYYTGLTRLARNILSEIVRGIFLKSQQVLSTIHDIACNAKFIAEAIQRCDEATFQEAIQRSWDLNCSLDRGTCPPQVAQILEPIAPFKPVYKLLGAGGGGYLLILAPSLDAAAQIKETLRNHPPNPRARFVQMSISQTGLQITRS